MAAHIILFEDTYSQANEALEANEALNLSKAFTFVITSRGADLGPFHTYRLFAVRRPRHDVVLSNNHGCLWTLSQVTTTAVSVVLPSTAAVVTTTPIWCQFDEALWTAWNVHGTLWTCSHLSTFHRLDSTATLLFTISKSIITHLTHITRIQIIVER